jgi:hypothetical protein
MLRGFRFLIVLAALLLPVPGLADSSTPNLVGTWVSVTGEVGHWEGVLKPFGTQVATLEVKKQLGGVFNGTMTYDNERHGPKFEGKAGVHHVQSETIVGVIDWDGRSIVWVDHEDETVHRARLTRPNVMEVIAFEPGDHAVVNRMIMIRK